MQYRAERDPAAALADTLTATRLVLSVPLFVAIVTGTTPVAALTLVLAWWTDFFDGRLARNAESLTRLGAWDPIADTAIGSALLAGLVVSGAAPMAPWGAVGLALLAAFIAHGNLAWCMLLQALAYELFFAQLWSTNTAWLLFLGTTALVMLVINRRRFFGELLPSFFSGIGAEGLASARAWERWR